MPSVHVAIGLEGKGFFGEVGMEGFAGVRMLEAPVLHGILDEGHMFFWTEEDFNRLPAHKAA